MAPPPVKSLPSPADPPSASFSLLNALYFAAARHAPQTRKDGVTPYFTHPIFVASLLAGIGHVTDPVLLQAAILHDVVEDTGTSPEELREQFGEDVCALVMEVTDDKALPKQERKRLQEVRAASLSIRAKQLKISDKSANCGDLSGEFPTGWTLERKLEYLNWAERVILACRGSNPALEAYFDGVVRERRATFGRR